MHRSTAFNATRCLSSSWEIAKQAPVPVWVAGLILVLIDGCTQGGGGQGNFSNGGDFSGDFGDANTAIFFVIGILLVVGFVLMIVFGALTAWLRVGYYTGIKKLMGGEDVKLEGMFGGHGRWLSTFLTVILQAVVLLGAGLGAIILIAIPATLFAAAGGAGVVAIVGAILLIPFYIYVALGLTFMRHAAAIDGHGPVESLRISWDLADGSRLDLFVIGLLQLLMIIVGLIACCVGVIPASILVEVMWVEAYVQVTGGPDSPARGGRPDSGAPSSGDYDSRQAPRRVEPEMKSIPLDPTPDQAASPNPETEAGGAPFDPAAWRQDSDIPPIQEDD